MSLLHADVLADVQRNMLLMALKTASCRGHADIVRLLLDAGADVTARDEHGDSQAHFAVAQYVHRHGTGSHFVTQFHVCVQQPAVSHSHSVSDRGADFPSNLVGYHSSYPLSSLSFPSSVSRSFISPKFHLGSLGITRAVSL